METWEQLPRYHLVLVEASLHRPTKEERTKYITRDGENMDSTIRYPREPFHVMSLLVDLSDIY
jgi:hypothetical protein